MGNFNPGDIVVILTGGLRGQIGIVQGEGNIWDFTVLVRGDTFRLDPEQLHKITMDELIQLATPVPEYLLVFLTKSL